MDQRIAETERGSDFTFSEPDTLGLAVIDVIDA
jgi:hypothetical protein